MFSLEPVQFFTHFQFSSVFYSFPIQFGFLFISNSVQLNWKWTELEMSWIGNECCVIILFALDTHAHNKTLKVETLDDLMVARTAHVEDKLVDLNETQHPIFD